MAHAKEIAVALFQHVGHDLEMDMGRPAAIFMPIAQMRDKLAGGHRVAHLHKAGQGACKVAIKRMKPRAPRIMFQDEGVAC